MKTEDSVEACTVKKEEEDLEIPSISYPDTSDDLFSRARQKRFSGNEDGKLLDHGIRLHLLLVTLQEYDELTEGEAQEFEVLVAAIRERASRLPPGWKSGRDNFGREYDVVGRHILWDYPLGIEKRRYRNGVGEEIVFSLCGKNYFYINPDGSIYGHYVLKDGMSKGIKLSRDKIKTYSYPPNTYMSQNGGQAERF